MTSATTEFSSFKTATTFFTVGGCSASLLHILNRMFGHPMEPEETAANPLAGGILQHGYQCGMLWGAALAAGAEAYRRYGAGPRAEWAAMTAAARLVERFAELNDETNCLELTDTNWRNKWAVLKYVAAGGPVGCGRMAVRFAPAAYETIDEALSVEPPEDCSACSSCAAELARKMGATEQQAVMAAALAGGIGLSGGGCGALGAAIWLTALNHPDDKITFSADGTRVGAVLERFLFVADHELECAEIVGRRFADNADHGRHLRAGGCAAMIDVLAATEAACDSSPQVQAA